MKTHIPTKKYLLILCCVLFLLGLTASQSGTAQTEEKQAALLNSGPVVARVDYDTRANLETLAVELDIWEVHADEGYLIAMLRPEDVARLQSAGYRVTVDVARTTELQTPRQALPGQINGIPGYACYRTVTETNATVYELASTYPTLASVVVIGQSWDKITPGAPFGYNINVIKLTNQNIPGPKPTFFLMGSIHAREYTTAETATRFAEDLLAKYGTNADVTWLLDNYEVHILPIANPDGRKIAETGIEWRKNTDSDDGCTNPSWWGTDLNRNHSFMWGGPGASTDPCDDTYRGPSAGSEPEVQAIQNYVLSLFPDQRGPNLTDPAPLDATGLLISLHSYSQLVLWPWGSTNSPAPNGTQLQTLGRKFAYFNHYTPQQSVNLYATSGTTDDWGYGELGIAAYTFEMGTDFFQDCTTFENTIYPNNLQALHYAFKAARRPYQSPAGPETLNVTLTPGGNNQVTINASANDNRYGGSGEPTQNIAAARYSLDLLSWQEGVTFFSMRATDGVFNNKIEAITANLDAACLAPGQHMVYLESQDTAGNWGVPSAAFLNIAERTASSIEPATQSGEAQAGETLTYTLQAANDGNVSDTYTVTLESQWPSALVPSVETLSLSACASTTITVTVSIPADALPGSLDTLTLTLTSHTNPAQQTSADITSQVSEATPTPTPTPTATPPPPPTFKIYLPNIVR